MNVDAMKKRPRILIRSDRAPGHDNGNRVKIAAGTAVKHISCERD